MSCQELEEFREQVRDFAQAVVAPHAEEIDRSNNFPSSVDLWRELGSFGLLGEDGEGGGSDRKHASSWW